MEEPIFVRGHHIDDFYRLHRFTLSGQEGDDRVLRAAKIAAAMTMRFPSNDPKERWYAADVLASPDREGEYRQKREAAFMRFIEAPPDAEVIVVACEPDDVCKACAVGAHCRMSRTLTDIGASR